MPCNTERVPPDLSFDAISAANALDLLADAAIAREENLREYSTVCREEADSGDEEESACPIIQAFEQSGASDSIRSATKVSSREFNLIFDKLEVVHSQMERIN